MDEKFENIEEKVEQYLSSVNSENIEYKSEQWNPDLPTKYVRLITYLRKQNFEKNDYSTTNDYNSNSSFITIEGIDNAGKTTVLEEIKNNIEGEFKTTTEPNDETWIGKQVRKALSSEEAKQEVVFYLFLADHVNHLNTVLLPYIRRGKTVLCDRYIDSRYAYQSVALDGFFENPLDSIRSIQENDKWTIMPDKTVLIDIPAEESINRMGDTTERFEKREFLEKVRENYLQLAEDFDDRIIKIDGTGTKEEVREKAVSKLEEELGQDIFN